MLALTLLAVVYSFQDGLKYQQCPAPIYLGIRHGCSKTFFAELKTSNVIRPVGYENLNMGSSHGNITLCVIKDADSIVSIRYHLQVPLIKHVISARLTVDSTGKPNGKAIANLVKPKSAGNSKVGIDFWGILNKNTHVFPFTTLAEVADAIEKGITHVLIRTDDGNGDQNTGAGGNS
eukprot:NODE_42_length_29671_cov_0.584810.p12 type:complete len:177 gc:universal NODE_42_length_29671_cov_0.584810:16417-15887(-)